MTRALRPLEKLGYVVTKRDVRDARRSLATLTTHGVKLASAGSAIVGETIADLSAMANLSAVDRKKISKFLQELTRDE